MLLAAERSGSVLISAGALLLLWAALPKLARGGWRRPATGLAEFLCGTFVLAGPGRPAAALLAAIFLGFTLVHLRGARAGASTCACFGEADPVDPMRAGALTGLVALLAAGAAAAGSPSLLQFAAHDAPALAWAPSAALLVAVAWRTAFSGGGSLGRIADVSGSILERGPSAVRPSTGRELMERRSFLLRVAVVGSALVTAPLRYMLYPGTALAAVVRPWDCHDGGCTDGYTAFCCEINDGLNACPTGTFAGGWWMCTDYSGRKLCMDQGVRYYVDCNALPGVGFPGGCRCADDNCTNRRINCNVFRYGQCNTHIEGTTAVVCRMIVCENPATVPELHCSAAMAVDDATCGHEAVCLEPPAVELAGAGGA